MTIRVQQQTEPSYIGYYDSTTDDAAEQRP